MDRAVWAVIYDLPEEGRDEYMAWYHGVHIPEKLARPGYAWAAHYEVKHPGERFEKIAARLNRTDDPAACIGRRIHRALRRGIHPGFLRPQPRAIKRTPKRGNP